MTASAASSDSGSDPLGGVDPRVSPKGYATAVVLSALLGFMGIQHFYLGRWGEGVLDLGLTVGWALCFASGDVLFGSLILVTDVAHSFVVTILLLTGSFHDGEGRLVCYPGQVLKPTTEVN